MNAQRFNGLDTRRMMAAAATVASVLTLGVTAADAAPKSGAGSSDPSAPYSDAMKTITGVLRDFRAMNTANGHPDFGGVPSAGAGHSVGNVGEFLDTGGDPVYVGGGMMLATEFRDSEGRAIHPSLFNASLGDTAGTFGAPSDGGVTSGSTFNDWYNDVPGMNTSGPFQIDFHWDSGSDSWVYDETLASNQAVIGGGGNSNFEYSYELNLQFVYNLNAGQFLEIGGMDDCFVFVNGQLVVDLGGVNHAERQYVPMDRLGLTDGQVYEMKILMTERIKQREDVRIAMNFEFWDGELPTTMAMFD